LTLGIGPVARIDTMVGGCSAKTASAIRTAHDRTTKEPSCHSLFVRSPPGLSMWRAPVAVRILVSEYRYGEKTHLLNTRAEYRAN